MSIYLSRVGYCSPTLHALACRSPGLSDRQRGVQPIGNNDRHTSRMRGYDFGYDYGL